jgi:hypothetical protein
MVGLPSGERLSFSGFPGRTKLLGAAVAPVVVHEDGTNRQATAGCHDHYKQRQGDARRENFHHSSVPTGHLQAHRSGARRFCVERRRC